MVKYKKILVFADFCSSGLWNALDPHHTMIDYEELKLPEKLVKEFKAWIEIYDNGYNRSYSSLKKHAVKPVYREGLRLAKKLKKLFPEIEVEYWAELYKLKHKKMKIR